MSLNENSESIREITNGPDKADLMIAFIEPFLPMDTKGRSYRRRLKFRCGDLNAVLYVHEMKHANTQRPDGIKFILTGETYLGGEDVGICSISYCVETRTGKLGHLKT